MERETIKKGASIIIGAGLVYYVFGPIGLAIMALVLLSKN